MGRSYRRNQVIAAVAGARAAKGDPFIGADIITGFPGESDEDFSATIDLLRETDPAWVHAFVFSPRPGTKAFAMKPKIPERVAVERARILARLAEEGKQRFAIRRIGTILEAVAEGMAPDPDSGPEGLAAAGLPASDLCTAVSADYLRLSVRGVPAGISTGFSCRASGLAQDGTHDLIADYIASIS
jgi:tRNA A37 methylthiotransferase MiaB